MYQVRKKSQLQQRHVPQVQYINVQQKLIKKQLNEGAINPQQQLNINWEPLRVGVERLNGLVSEHH